MTGAQICMMLSGWRIAGIQSAETPGVPCRDHRHARDFSLKVPASRSRKSALELGGAAHAAASPDTRYRAKNPYMVTLQIQRLIDFVAEVFTHSDSSPEEAKR